MTDVDPIKAVVEIAGDMRDPAKLKSLEFLFEYTKFHIGLYLTLTASFIALATVKVKENLVLPLNGHLVWIAVIAFMVAGLAGGVIASSITQCECASASEFLSKDIGPWGFEGFHFMSARSWTYVEHTSFWIGLVSAVLSFKDTRKWSA